MDSRLKIAISTYLKKYYYHIISLLENKKRLLEFWLYKYKNTQALQTRYISVIFSIWVINIGWLTNPKWAFFNFTVNNFQASYPRPLYNKPSKNFPSHPLADAMVHMNNNQITSENTTPSHYLHWRIFLLLLAHSSLFSFKRLTSLIEFTSIWRFNIKPR